MKFNKCLPSTTFAQRSPVNCQAGGEHGALKASPFTVPKILHLWEPLNILNLCSASRPYLKWFRVLGVSTNGRPFCDIKVMLIS